MAVDVHTETVIDRPVGAAYAADPGSAHDWYENITAVQWQTTPPLQVGSRRSRRGSSAAP